VHACGTEPDIRPEVRGAVLVTEEELARIFVAPAGAAVEFPQEIRIVVGSEHSGAWRRGGPTGCRCAA
jgi:hypothetical protein